MYNIYFQTGMFFHQFPQWVVREERHNFSLCKPRETLSLNQTRVLLTLYIFQTLYAQIWIDAFELLILNGANKVFNFASSFAQGLK